MAVAHSRVLVSTAAVALNAAASGGMTLVVTNTTANAADLGSSSVAAGAGLPLAANASTTVILGPGEVLYAIRTAAADTTLAVLRTQG